MDRPPQNTPLALQFGDVGRPVTPNLWMPLSKPDFRPPPWVDDPSKLEEQAQLDVLCPIPTSPNTTNTHSIYIPEHPSPTYVTVTLRQPKNPHCITQSNLAMQLELHRELQSEPQQGLCIAPPGVQLSFHPPPPVHIYGPALPVHSHPAPLFHTHGPAPPFHTHGPAPTFHIHGPAPFHTDGLAPTFHTHGSAPPFLTYGPAPLYGLPPPMAQIHCPPVLLPDWLRPPPICYSQIFCNKNFSPMRRPESFGGLPVSPGADGLPEVCCPGVWNGSAEENVVKWLTCYQIELWRFQDMQEKIASIVHEYYYGIWRPL